MGCSRLLRCEWRDFKQMVLFVLNCFFANLYGQYCQLSRPCTYEHTTRARAHTLTHTNTHARTHARTHRCRQVNRTEMGLKWGGGGYDWPQRKQKKFRSLVHGLRGMVWFWVRFDIKRQRATCADWNWQPKDKNIWCSSCFKKTCVHNAFYYPCYDQGKKKLPVKKKCYKEKQKEQKTNVKCMGCETYLSFQSDRNCSVFMSVSVIHCNVCAYVALNGCHA